MKVAIALINLIYLAEERTPETFQFVGLYDQASVHGQWATIVSKVGWGSLRSSHNNVYVTGSGHEEDLSSGHSSNANEGLDTS